MKKIILTALLVLPFFYATIKAQTGPKDIISKENVTIEKLKAIFENSKYEIIETTATYVKIKDIFNIYIDLDKDNRYLTFSVNWPINEEFGLADKYRLMNKISKEVLVVTPYYNDAGNSIIIKTTVWIEGGNTVKNIVLTEKIFVKALNLILDKDADKIIK
jgi:hypothetical protein